MKISVLYYLPALNESLLCPPASINRVWGLGEGCLCLRGGAQRKDGKRGSVTSWDCKLWGGGHKFRARGDQPPFSRNIINKREF